MRSQFSLICLFFLACCLNLNGQERVGINTTNPQRPLDMYGSGTQYLRLQSNNTIGNEAAIELIRGSSAGGTTDWKIANTMIGLRFAKSIDNFSANNATMLLLDNSGDLGIGISTPQAKVHVAVGESASNSNDGYLLVGNKSGSNLVMDNDGILARYNGVASSLHLQTLGANTQIGGTVATTHTVIPVGDLVIGGGAVEARLNVQDEQFQVTLRNEGAGANTWYIGATNENWIAGNNQLIFSPTGNSDDAPLRLMDVGENDGDNAPVIIRNHPDQTLLIDGNEIDGETGPLYINHNSDEETYVNPTGGDVGVGTTNPQARLHVTTSNFALGLQRDGLTWRLAPATSGDVIFSNNNGPLALISWNGGGTWIPLSDSTRKHQVKPMDDAMDRINRIRL
ncbi:MAG: hypothetical protein R3330_03575, partial [Saprospiraceae bacterium]|nr:hypothetical protein [Saprospiraceae bacterium]